MRERWLSFWQLTTLCTPFAAGPPVKAFRDIKSWRVRLPGCRIAAFVRRPFCSSAGRVAHPQCSSCWRIVIICRRPVLEEFARFVRRPFLARLALISAMFGIAVLFLPFPARAFSSPAVSVTQSHEDDCDGNQGKERQPTSAGNPAQVIKRFAARYAICPSYENGRDLADAEIKAGQYESAKSLLGTLLEQRDRAELHTLLGNAESGEKNYKAAAIEYQKAATMDPSEANVFDFGMSLLHLDQNAAITIFRYGLEKYPKSVKIHVALGAALYTAGKSLEGAQLLCDAEDLNPSDPHPMEILADTEIVPPALAPRITSQLASLHRRYPRDGLLLFDYTMVQSGRWSNDKAALPPHFTDSLKEALSLNPRLPQAYFQLGLVYLEQGNSADAIRVLKKAISLDPINDEYHYRLAFAYRKSGNEEKFHEELDQFQKLHGKDSDGK
jgi:tetratricopeptide (TPR) repeat protein